MNTAATMVAAWIQRGHGRGPSMASGNHVQRELRALPTAPQKIISTMIVENAAGRLS
jgi:hypothetical protein